MQVDPIIFTIIQQEDGLWFGNVTGIVDKDYDRIKARNITAAKTFNCLNEQYHDAIMHEIANKISLRTTLNKLN